MLFEKSHVDSPALPDVGWAIGAIDVYHLWITPVTIGGGKPFFTPDYPMENLDLIDMRRFPEGTVALEYAVRS